MALEKPITHGVEMLIMNNISGKKKKCGLKSRVKVELSKLSLDISTSVYTCFNLSIPKALLQFHFAQAMGESVGLCP